MLGAVRVAVQQQQRQARGQHEQYTDQRFLLCGEAPFGVRQQRGAGERGAGGNRLHRPAMRLEAEHLGGDHAEHRDLGNGQIDEHDAALQHFLAERHVRGEHQQPGQQRRQQHIQFQSQIHRAASLSRAMVISNSLKRSSAPSAPTV